MTFLGISSRKSYMEETFRKFRSAVKVENFVKEAFSKSGVGALLPNAERGSEEVSGLRFSAPAQYSFAFL